MVQLSNNSSRRRIARAFLVIAPLLASSPSAAEDLDRKSVV